MISFEASARSSSWASLAATDGFLAGMEVAGVHQE